MPTASGPSLPLRFVCTRTGTHTHTLREDFQTPGFLPGQSHGQRSPAGFSPWGRKRVTPNLATKQLGV